MTWLTQSICGIFTTSRNSDHLFSFHDYYDRGSHGPVEKAMSLLSFLVRICSSPCKLCADSAWRRPVEYEVTTMKLKTVYLILCFLGVALTYWQFVPWVVQNGLDMSLFFHQLFANRIGAFFGMDVFVSAVALVVFMREESSRVHVGGRWLPILALLLVGVSLALPMFLYMRERELKEAG
jgi:Terpene cyclase DEP1